jgi:hypothetical protein
VVHAIEKAVFKRWPAARYAAPAFFKPLVWSNAFMPTWLMDWLMCWAIGLTKKGVTGK